MTGLDDVPSGSDDRVKLYIIAGEQSGDAIGGRLLESLHERLHGGISIAGVGGSAMEAQGLKSLFPIKEIALMGLLELLPHIPRLRARIAETARDIEGFGPDALITIDAPGFCKRVVDRLPASSDILKVHYVAPTVWAWRPGRVHGFKKRFDLLLALLPFEPPYFKTVGLPTEFVGHPVLQSGADGGDGAAFRERYGIRASDPVLCVLPGSRAGEVSRLLPPFLRAAGLVRDRNPDLWMVLPTLPSMRALVDSALGSATDNRTIIVEQNEKFDAMAGSNAAVAASGTVALELAMARVPTVIAYRVNWVTYQIVRRLIKIRFVHLLNYLCDERIVPELLQNECRPDLLGDAVLQLLGEAGHRQLTKLGPALEKLKPVSTDGGTRQPSDAAADAILDLFALKTGKRPWLRP